MKRLLTIMLTLAAVGITFTLVRHPLIAGTAATAASSAPGGFPGGGNPISGLGEISAVPGVTVTTPAPPAIDTALRCGTRHPTRLQASQIELMINRLERKQGPVTRQRTNLGPKAPSVIKVHFHVIFYNGPLLDENGNVVNDNNGNPIIVNEGRVSNTQIQRQIDVLNAAFSGKDPAAPSTAANTPFRFELASVSRTNSYEWFYLMGLSAYGFDFYERQAKSALRKGGKNELNMYTSDLLSVGLLGFATFPFDIPEFGYVTDPVKDGVVCDYNSLPSGTKPSPFVYNFDQGDTATHEIGHWMGLYHTFQDGCSRNNDYVGDTAASSFPTFLIASEFPPGVDTCSLPGRDSSLSFMDYSDDLLASMFTKGQSVRMDRIGRLFRGL